MRSDESGVRPSEETREAMSCWVVPTIAADLWKLPLEQVLRAIVDGNLASRIEQGFVFVDVAPSGASVAPAPALPHVHPPTFSETVEEPALDPASDVPAEEDVVSRAELEALVNDDADAGDGTSHEPVSPVQVDGSDELDEMDLPEFDPEKARSPFADRDWHSVRRHVSKLRVPPPQFRN